MLMKVLLFNIIVLFAIINVSAQFNENAPWMKDLKANQQTSKLLQNANRQKTRKRLAGVP